MPQIKGNERRNKDVNKDTRLDSNKSECRRVMKQGDDNVILINEILRRKEVKRARTSKGEEVK